jgi:hypothetical protein
MEVWRGVIGERCGEIEAWKSKARCRRVDVEELKYGF